MGEREEGGGGEIRCGTRFCNKKSVFFYGTTKLGVFPHKLDRTLLTTHLRHHPPRLPPFANRPDDRP